MVQQMEVGHLHFGARPRLALQLTYSPDVKTQETIQVAFDNLTTFKQVWADLIVDAPCDRSGGFSRSV